MYQEYTLFLFSTLPALVSAILLVGLRWPAKIVMPLALASVLVPSYLVWKVPANVLAAQFIDGVFTAGGILYIVFAALILLNTLKETGALVAIKTMFTQISTDPRIQVIIILWLFGAFLEGAAGFGSTGAVIGPLLLGIGFPAMAAAMLCMIFQSTSVSFGAVGTPVLVGLSVGLGGGELDGVNYAGLSWSEYIHLLGHHVAVVNAIVAVLMPLIMSAGIGATGAFIAGSNTLCNMMFSLFQYKVAEMSGLDTTWVVTVQSVGAAAGNMVCVHNVVMAAAAVGLSGCEGDIIRKNILPATYYILGAAAVAYIALYGFAFHFGSYYLLIIALLLLAGIYKARLS